MFIRVKRIKKGNYAYLVKNTWTKKGPRQKTKKYLGRCYELKDRKEMDFKEHYGTETERFVHSNTLRKILGRAIEFELLRHGFVKDKDCLKKDEIRAYPYKLRIRNSDGNDAVLRLNEGYLCEYMVKKITKFRFSGEEEDAYKFADCFIAAGLDVDRELFIEIYRKATNQ